MGIIAWVVLGLAAGLAASMLIPGKRSQGLLLAGHLVTGRSGRSRRPRRFAHR